MPRILLIERNGEQFHVLAKKANFSVEVVALEEKTTKQKILKQELEYELIRLENGVTKETIGYVSEISNGEKEFYQVIGTKTYKHIYRIGYSDITLWVSKEKINIVEIVHDIEDFC